MRVASSAQAKEYGDRRFKYDEMAWEFTQRYKEQQEHKSNATSKGAKL